MEVNSKPKVDFSSSWIDKKINRTSNQKALNEKKNDLNDQKNMKLILKDATIDEFHVEIDFDSNFSELEKPREKIRDHISILTQPKESESDGQFSKDSLLNESRYQIHRHRHLRKRNFKINSNVNIRNESNESIDDSKMIPVINFNKEIYNSIHSSNSQSELNKYTSNEKNQVKTRFLISRRDNNPRINSRSSSLNRDININICTPNFKSISLEEIDFNSLNEIFYNEKTCLFCNNFSSNMELSTKGQQILNYLDDDNLVLNNKKNIDKNTNSITKKSSDILKKNYKLTQRYKLIVEGEVNLCKLTHNKNVFTKIFSSKLLRRWKTHRLLLRNSAIYSATVN